MTSSISAEIYNEFARGECWETYQNCDKMLSGLKTRGYKMGVISNFDERLFAITEQLGIKKFFDFIVIPANANGSYKPQREIFDRAFKLSGSPESIVHVGDSLELDYLPARAANFKSILVFHKPPTVSDLVDARVKEVVDAGDYAVDLKSLEEKIIKM
jgi:HAD superfamily hydrolase (TIGR01549 family)